MIVFDLRPFSWTSGCGTGGLLVYNLYLKFDPDKNCKSKPNQLIKRCKQTSSDDGWLCCVALMYF